MLSLSQARECRVNAQFKFSQLDPELYLLKDKYFSSQIAAPRRDFLNEFKVLTNSNGMVQFVNESATPIYMVQINITQSPYNPMIDGVNHTVCFPEHGV